MKPNLVDFDAILGECSGLELSRDELLREAFLRESHEIDIFLETYIYALNYMKYILSFGKLWLVSHDSFLLVFIVGMFLQKRFSSVGYHSV